MSPEAEVQTIFHYSSFHRWKLPRDLSYDPHPPSPGPSSLLTASVTSASHLPLSTRLPCCRKENGVTLRQ